jgi:Tol biopolymer transport system component
MVDVLGDLFVLHWPLLVAGLAATFMRRGHRWLALVGVTAAALGIPFALAFAPDGDGFIFSTQDVVLLLAVYWGFLWLLGVGLGALASSALRRRRAAGGRPRRTRRWAAVAVMVVVGLAAAAVAVAVGSREGDSPRHRTVGYAGWAEAWSADGKALVFTYAPVLCCRPPGFLVFDRTWTAEERAEIWVADPAGRRARRLARGSAPAVSPDGKTVAYTRWLAEDPAASRVIAVARTDGTGRRDLTPADASFPAWSPDGTRIAYLHGVDESGAGALAVVDADGSGRRVLTDERVSWHEWTADGRRIVYHTHAGGESRWSIGADEKAPRRLPERVDRSPDGRFRTVTRDVPGTSSISRDLTPGGDFSPGIALFVGEADGTATRRVSKLPLDSHEWSPRSDWIVLDACCIGDERDGIYVVRPDGRGLRRVVRSASFPLHWSPDGRSFVVEEFDPRSLELVTLGRTRAEHRSVSLRGASHPAWSPDGRNLAFARTEEAQRGVYVLARGRARTRRVTRISGTPLWSPDGKRIAISHPFGRGEIHVVDADGAGLWRASPGR